MKPLILLCALSAARVLSAQRTCHTCIEAKGNFWDTERQACMWPAQTNSSEQPATPAGTRICSDTDYCLCSSCDDDRCARVGMGTTTCDASSLITKHEGSRSCSYTDTTGHKTVGVGFNLDAVSASTFESILPGVDYNAVYSGATCLTSTQINTLLHYSMQKAIAESKRVVSNYGSMCCNVQNVVTDMTFNLGSLSSFYTLVKYFEEADYADAAADMKGTLWCSQVGSRCTEDASMVAQGCGGPAPAPSPTSGCKACVSGGGGSGCLDKCAGCGSTCTNCIKGGGGMACADRCC